MADLLRFKDVLEMDNIGPLDNPKALSFNDLHVSQYMPGEDEQVNYRAYRRHRTIGVGEGGPVSEAVNPLDKQPLSTGKHKKSVGMGYTGKHTTIKTPGQPARHTHVFQLTGEEKEVDEALTVTQRLARKRLFKRIQPKIKLGRERAKRRFADKERLRKRAIKQARMMLFKKLTKEIPKDELSYARRQEIEKRLDKPQMKARIQQIARKLLPKVRKKEVERRRAK